MHLQSSAEKLQKWKAAVLSILIDTPVSESSIFPLEESLTTDIVHNFEDKIFSVSN